MTTSGATREPYPYESLRADVLRCLPKHVVNGQWFQSSDGQSWRFNKDDFQVNKKSKHDVWVVCQNPENELHVRWFPLEFLGSIQRDNKDNG